MPFVSIEFIAFMGVVFAAYFLVPAKVRWVVLLIASYVFYWLYSEWLILIMFGQTLVTYLCGRAMGHINSKCDVALAAVDEKDAKKDLKAKAKKQTRHIMWLGVLINLLTLLFLK